MTLTVQTILSWIITLSNILQLNLTKTYDCTSSSCYGQEFTCSTSDTTCVINCGGNGGTCSLATFTIEQTADKMNIAQITCNENSSCDGTKIYSQRAVNMQCNANASCSNSYVTVTWNDRNNGLAPSTFTITEPNNDNIYFECSGEGIGQCNLNCGPSNTYPNGGVTLCSNGYFNCDLSKTTCIWDCINTNYNYCYNNTMNCVASNKYNLCYKTNAENSQVNAIYLTSFDPTKTPTNTPTSNISEPTVSPNIPTPLPTYPVFEFTHILNFTLIMTTNNWTKDNIILTTEGMQLFIKLLNETKDIIHHYVFQQGNNGNDTNIGFYDKYHIKPGHCNIYDMNNGIINNSIYFDCELNSDNATVIYTINEVLSMLSIINQISNSINNAMHSFLSNDVIGPLATVGLISIKFIYYSIIFPTKTPTDIPTNIPSNTPSIITIMPSITPTIIPTTSGKEVDVSTTFVTIIIDTLDKFSNENKSSNDVIMFIVVIVGCLLFLFCVILVLYYVHTGRASHSSMDVKVILPMELGSKSPLSTDNKDGNMQFTIPEKENIIKHNRQNSEGPGTGVKYSYDGHVQTGIQLQQIDRDESIDDINSYNGNLKRIKSEGPKVGSQYSENNDLNNNYINNEIENVIINEINETDGLTPNGQKKDDDVDDILVDDMTPQQIHKLSSTTHSDNSIVNGINEFVSNAENDEEIINDNVVNTAQ
eukprot:464003_1